jgi:hypothetical protein
MLDMSTRGALVASEENGNLVISVMGDLKGKTLYTKDKETVYTKTIVIVDANTNLQAHVYGICKGLRGRTAQGRTP